MTIQQLVTGLVLGIAALSGAPAAAEECSAGGPALDVMTLNTWGLPPPVARDRKGRLPKIQRMVDEGALDVVGLQEVWSGALHLLTLKLFRPDGEDDTGLAVVTPHAVSGRRSVVYRNGHGTDRLKQKGAMAMEVEIPEAGASWVVVTHLQSGYGDAPARVRASQVDELLALTSMTSGPAMMMGDFNLYDESALDLDTARRLSEAGWVDAAVALGETSPTYPDKGERFDRILLRSGPETCLRAESVEVIHPKVRLSDHLPVRAAIRVGRVQEP